MLPTSDPAFHFVPPQPAPPAQGGDAKRQVANARTAGDAAPAACEECGADGDCCCDDGAGSTSSGGAHAHGGRGSGRDARVARAFAPDAPLPWASLLRLRRSWTSAPVLTAAQEANVVRAVGKLREGAGSIHDSVPVVCAAIEKLCPDLRSTRPANASGPREGATYTLLAVITGRVELLKTCLELGANPNDERFLMDARPQRQHYLRHGYTPFFMACICEQRECMDLLHAHGASLHTIDRWGRTPLHAATALGNRAVVDWLLAHGAPRLVTDRDSFRPGEVCAGKQALPPRDPRFPHVLLRPPGATPLPCACGSGRACGACGCSDDMHERWYLDRVATKWIPAEISAAVAEAQAAVLSLALPGFVAQPSDAATAAAAA